MSNLQRYDNDGFELVINTVTGESFATVSGYARMVGLTQQAISKRIKGHNSDVIKTAEILTPGGLQGAYLIPESLITQWIVKDSPELAVKMLQAGVRVFLHQLAGFKVTSEATQPVPQLPPSDIRVTNLMNTLEKLGVDLANPRFKQPLADMALNILGVTKGLPGVSGEYLGVAEIAEGLGYHPILVAKHRSKLGKYVKQFSGVTPTQERRLVNGTYRVVNVYPSSQSVVDTISEFFELHILPTNQ